MDCTRNCEKCGFARWTYAVGYTESTIGEMVKRWGEKECRGKAFVLLSYGSPVAVVSGGKICLGGNLSSQTHRDAEAALCRALYDVERNPWRVD